MVGFLGNVLGYFWNVTIRIRNTLDPISQPLLAGKI